MFTLKQLYPYPIQPAEHPRLVGLVPTAGGAIVVYPGRAASQTYGRLWEQAVLYQYPAAGAPELMETHRPLLESGSGYSNKIFARLSTTICKFDETYSMVLKSTFFFSCFKYPQEIDEVTFEIHGLYIFVLVISKFVLNLVNIQSKRHLI